MERRESPEELDGRVSANRLLLRDLRKFGSSRIFALADFRRGVRVSECGSGCVRVRPHIPVVPARELRGKRPLLPRWRLLRRRNFWEPVSRGKCLMCRRGRSASPPQLYRSLGSWFNPERGDLRRLTLSTKPDRWWPPPGRGEPRGIAPKPVPTPEIHSKLNVF